MKEILWRQIVFLGFSNVVPLQFDDLRRAEQHFIVRCITSEALIWHHAHMRTGACDQRCVLAQLAQMSSEALGGECCQKSIEGETLSHECLVTG